MASEMVSRVLDAEAQAGDILEKAHSEAFGAIEHAGAQGASLSSTMLEEARAEAERIRCAAAERSDYVAVEALKRAALEKDRLIGLFNERRGETLSALTETITGK